MKFFHLSDLHIGKQLHHYNLKEDQRAILSEIIQYAKELQPDAILIAGDIYDKSVPSAEAVSIFDDFLTELSEITPAISVLLIAGNHDSAERLEFASSILGRHHIHIAGMPPRTPSEHIKQVRLDDAFGPVNFFLLPFLKPGYVRGVFETEIPQTYHDAVAQMLAREELPANERNVLLTHQFYTNQQVYPETCDSETISIGGLDNVDISVLKDFDYAALGHIHGPQNFSIPHIRYCGTPLKYSVSECNHRKSLTVVTLSEKGTPPALEYLPLHPLRDVRKMHGPLDDILSAADTHSCDDFVSITITDEIEPYKPKDQLEDVYSHILEIRVDNQRTRGKLESFDDLIPITNPLDAFLDFYQEIQGHPASAEETALITTLIQQAKEDN